MGFSQHKRAQRNVIIAIVLCAGSALTLTLACSLGSAVSFGDFFVYLWQKAVGAALPAHVEAILFSLRLPRALLGFTVGGALGVSGCCMQAMFKNPMADPHTLGVSGGGALGATLAMTMGIGVSQLALTAASFTGAVASIAIVYAIGRIRGRVTTVSLLLSGIAVSSLMTALIQGMMFFNYEKIEKITLWMMGSFSAAGWKQLTWSAPLIILCALACMMHGKELNLLLLGDEEARQLGVNTGRTRLVLTLFSTLASAAAVSVSGIIGFVGLMVPHIMRLLSGPDHKTLLPFSFVGGGLFLMLADLCARTLAAPRELPVGVITAVLGVPFFLYLLRSKGLKGRGI